MRRLILATSLIIPSLCLAEDEADIFVPEPPELPLPVKNGEPIEPDITIIRKDKETIQEYRVNGELYMVKIVPDVGPAYYLIDSNGDGNMDTRKSDLDKGLKINQWKLFEWDWP